MKPFSNHFPTESEFGLNSIGKESTGDFGIANMPRDKQHEITQDRNNPQGR